MFTDTHCHLYKEYYEDLDEILKNCQENKINRMINNGCDSKSNQEVLYLITKYPNMYGALGIHPESVDTYKEEDLIWLEKNLKNKNQRK